MSCEIIHEGESWQQVNDKLLWRKREDGTLITLRHSGGQYWDARINGVTVARPIHVWAGMTLLSNYNFEVLAPDPHTLSHELENLYLQWKLLVHSIGEALVKG